MSDAAEVEYSFLVSPLAVVAGIGDPDNKTVDLQHTNPKTLIPLDEIVICNSSIKDVNILDDIHERLAALSRPPGPWNSRMSKEDRLNISFSNTIQVPLKSVKPSAISVRNPASNYPIFTSEWIKKYLYYQPTVAVIFCKSPQGEAAEDTLIESLIALIGKLAEHGIHLIVAIVGERDRLAQQVPFLRKQIGISSSSALSLPEDSTEQETKTIIQTLYHTMLASSQEFFANKIRSLRAKRKAVAPPLDLIMWDTRFTLKLAYCSEFKGDLAGSIKLYESAYDSLAVLFDNKAVMPASAAYQNARLVLDAVAIKIFQHSLPSRLAFEKLKIHLSTIEHMWSINGIDKNAPHCIHWRAMQHAVFAQYCMNYKQSGVATSGLTQNPAGMPTGLIWLDAAVLFASEPSKDVPDDPYVFPSDTFYETQATDDKKSPQSAFLNAISELSGYKRTKAYALSKYGAWLNNTDPEAASQAFKSAQQMLSPKIWPEVQTYLSKQLNDRVMLFTVGELKEMPSLNRVDPNDVPPLFKCTGTFERSETHIGREIRAQVTLNPLFSGTLKLDKLRISHSLGSVTFAYSEPTATATTEHSNKVLIIASNQADEDNAAHLQFSEGKACTFQFSFTPVETADVELLEVEVTIDNDFVHKYSITEGSGSWLMSPDYVSPRTLKHLALTDDPLFVSVTTRPAKLVVNDLTPNTAAVGEKLRFNFEIRSHEEQDIEPRIKVTLASNSDSEAKELEFDDSQTKAIKAGGSYVSVFGNCDVPSSTFELRLFCQFDTTTDTLPVEFQYQKEVEVIKPFRVGFDLIPEYIPQEWPAVFAPTIDLPQLSRKWRLNCTVLSLFTGEDIIFHSSNLRVDTESADIEIESPSEVVDQKMRYNSMKLLSHTFQSRSKDQNPLLIPRKFEAAAYFEIEWSRKSLGIRNCFKLPPVRLNLPTQEPRVLAVADKVGGSLNTSQVTFYIENPSSRLLNFSISMSSSTFFAFQGPKAINLRMLPFSHRALTYQLTPLGDGSVQNKRPLPELRVYDINYKRTLAILPGDTKIKYEQGSLFL